MKRFLTYRTTLPLIAWATLAGLLPATLLAQNAPPARINTQSIQTSDGRPLFLRGLGRGGVQPAAYDGGFFHFRAAQREQYQQGPMTGVLDGPDMTPTDTLMPPMPDGGMPEEIVGQLEGPDQVMTDGGYGHDHGYGPVDGGFYCSDCEKGKSGGAFDDWNWACLCLPLPPDDNFSVNAGVHAFQGPLNIGGSGSFGFQEGANLGAAVPWVTLGIGWQLGVQGTQSNFGGQGLFSDEERDQVFVTAGFFRRVDCGLQGGVVVDYLHDEWFYDLNVSQIRGELSWVCGGCFEFGVFGNFSNGSDTSEVRINGVGNDVWNEWELDDGVTITADPTELFAVFYRHHFGECGQTYGRIYLGITGDRGSIFGQYADEGSAAVLGADMHICLSDHWALETGFTYLPATDDDTLEDSNIAVGAFQESWNVGINLIWYPRGQTFGECRSYYRPLFNVADNGSFLTHISDVQQNINP